jgi:hypothetical protein
MAELYLTPINYSTRWHSSVYILVSVRMSEAFTQTVCFIMSIVCGVYDWWFCLFILAQLTPWWKLFFTQLVRNLSVHVSLSWLIESNENPHTLFFWDTILILFSHLCWGLPSGLFSSGFLTKILCAFLMSPCWLHVLSISSINMCRVQIM